MHPNEEDDENEAPTQRDTTYDAAIAYLQLFPVTLRDMYTIVQGEIDATRDDCDVQPEDVWRVRVLNETVAFLRSLEK